jgi:hypothetical protein
VTRLDALADPTAWADLGPLLQDWATQQRWFGAKAHGEVASEIADAALLTRPDWAADVRVVVLAVD